jgi:hypothetical protein
MSASTQLDRILPGGLQPEPSGTQHGMIGKTAAILEKLEEAPCFTIAHVRNERGAHQNLA